MTPIMSDLLKVQRLVEEQQHRALEERSDMLELLLGLADLLERMVNHEYVDREHALAMVHAAKRLGEP